MSVIAERIRDKIFRTDSNVPLISEIIKPRRSGSLRKSRTVNSKAIIAKIQKGMNDSNPI